MPQGRPYSLGHTSDDMTASNRISEVSSASRARDRRYDQAAVADRDVAEPSPAVKPVAAFAPVTRDGNGSLMSGRGLY